MALLQSSGLKLVVFNGVKNFFMMTDSLVIRGSDVKTICESKCSIFASPFDPNTPWSQMLAGQPVHLIVGKAHPIGSGFPKHRIEEGMVERNPGCLVLYGVV